MSQTRKPAAAATANRLRENDRLSGAIAPHIKPPTEFVNAGSRDRKSRADAQGRGRVGNGVHCLVCSAALDPKRGSRRQRFCSNACRQSAFRSKKWGRRRKAITEIEMGGLKAQEKLALAGLTSDAARSFIEQLPGIDTLMPALSFAEIAGEAEPPIAEQLVSSNALRQRRFREKQAALRRNGEEALQAPSRNADEDADNEGRS
jgi:predicted nucleic acid-binding Zn ribbon protein